MQASTKDIEKKLAEEFGVPQQVVKDVPYSVCELVKQAMKEGKGDSVRLMYFGIFVPKSKVVKKKNK